MKSFEWTSFGAGTGLGDETIGRTGLVGEEGPEEVAGRDASTVAGGLVGCEVGSGGEEMGSVLGCEEGSGLGCEEVCANAGSNGREVENQSKLVD